MSRVPQYLDLPDKPVNVTGMGARLPAWHVFAQQDVEAVNAALAAGRPLLLLGEPGTGKSQLARAVAKELKRAFVAAVIDAQTEARDLHWTFDAVRRLADAQLLAARAVQGAGQSKSHKDELQKAAEDLLNERCYTRPGPLWWGFEWGEAEKQAARSNAPVLEESEGCSHKNGVVVLLDEIDKADSSVPNALLGSLGDGWFEAPGSNKVVCGEIEPLVVITTNQERALPAAFRRRCVVHHFVVPTQEKELKQWLLARGKAHFGDRLEPKVLEAAADLLWKDRAFYQEHRLTPPGCAEYLDLLRVLAERADTKEPAELLETVFPYLLQKHLLKRPRQE